MENCSSLANITNDRGNEAWSALNIACTTLRNDADAARRVTSHGVCFRRGLVALREGRDLNLARADFTEVCNDNDQSDSPYACKHLAMMTRDGLGGDLDAGRAFELFQQSCIPVGPWMGDGEGCLIYGDSLIENRDRIDYDQASDTLVLRPAPIAPDNARSILIVTEASRVYAFGCTSKWDAACRAGDALVSRRLDGEFPRDTTRCQIRDKSGQILSDQTCDVMRCFKKADTLDAEDQLVIETIFIWRDGDRTIVTDYNGDRLVNGVLSRPEFFSDELECLINTTTSNSFCSSINISE